MSSGPAGMSAEFLLAGFCDGGRNLTYCCFRGSAGFRSFFHRAIDGRGKESDEEELGEGGQHVRYVVLEDPYLSDVVFS